MAPSLDVAWTPAELETVRRFYGQIPMHELAAKLPKRTPAAIYFRAYKMGLKSNRPGPRRPRASAAARPAPDPASKPRQRLAHPPRPRAEEPAPEPSPVAPLAPEATGPKAIRFDAVVPGMRINVYPAGTLCAPMFRTITRTEIKAIAHERFFGIEWDPEPPPGRQEFPGGWWNLASFPKLSFEVEK